MIGHHGTSLEGVDVSIHKVSDILDLLMANITPEEWCSFNVSLKEFVLFTSPPYIERIIDQAAKTRETFASPVDAFLTA